MIRFGVFELDADAGTLTRSGRRVHLPPQAIRLLDLLAGRAGQLVTRSDIREALWGGDTFVDFDASVNACISQIRTALGDSATAPRFLETVPRKGYRFVAPIGEGETEILAATRPGRLRFAGAAAALSIGLVGLLWFGVRASEPWRVAVLPIEAPLADAELESLGALLQEATLVETHRLADASIAAVARPAVAHLRGARRTMAGLRESRVDYFVDATLQRVEDGRVRLHAKVVRTRDQRILWARDYQFPTAIFVQQRLPLASELARSLGEAPRGIRAAEQSRSTRVSDAILSAVHNLQEGPSGIGRAIALLTEACELEPRNSGARGLLAFAHARAALAAPDNPAPSWQRARLESARALARQPDNPEASAAMGAVLLFADGDRDAAGPYLRRAAAHHDAPLQAGIWLARWYSLTGAHDKAVAQARLIETMAPVTMAAAPLAEALYEAGRLPDARQAAERVLAIHPESQEARRLLRAGEAARR